jgi:hypothetical protein
VFVELQAITPYTAQYAADNYYYHSVLLSSTRRLKAAAPDVLLYAALVFPFGDGVVFFDFFRTMRRAPRATYGFQ